MVPFLENLGEKSWEMSLKNRKKNTLPELIWIFESKLVTDIFLLLIGSQIIFFSFHEAALLYSFMSIIMHIFKSQVCYTKIFCAFLKMHLLGFSHLILDILTHTASNIHRRVDVVSLSWLEYWGRVFRPLQGFSGNLLHLSF